MAAHRQRLARNIHEGLATAQKSGVHVAVDLFNQHLFEHQSLFERLGQLRPMVDRAADCIARRLALGGKLLLCGNGGSAADCQHLAAEFVGRFVRDRRPLAAIALTTDSSALTCIGNDYGFDQVFARQVEGIGRAGDVLIGISTSGASPNVLLALQAARRMGVRTIGLLGRDGGACAAECDVPLIVPSDITARIQEAHIFLGHLLCAEVEQRLGM
jgi:D-sedoheptulose 7-phosphate isomerase